MASPRSSVVCTFKFTLEGVRPSIWRRVAVPEHYSFWDLHVAIQDSMGWLDYHLHAFELPVSETSDETMEVGIPDDEFDRPIAAGWEKAIADYFVRPGMTATYTYDFGDDWRHEILLEQISPAEKATKYPKCISGERACPPEDCGGVPGYLDLLRVLRSPKHKEYSSMVKWLQGHAKTYWPYDPECFDPSSIRFSDPRKRWVKAFSGRR